MKETFELIDKMPGALIALIILGIAAALFLFTKQLPHIPPPPINRNKLKNTRTGGR